MSKLIKKSRGFCITVNNYDDEDIEIMKSYYTEDPLCTYLIIGKEIAPRTKTRHLQCYIKYKNQLSVKKIIKQFSPWHVEPQRAKRDVEAYVYCMEDGDYEEFGTRPQQGQRNDLNAIKHDILKGRPIEEIADNYFSQWVQYRRSFDEYKRMKSQKKYKTKLATYDIKNIAQEYPIMSAIEHKHIVSPKLDIEIMDILQLKDTGTHEYIFIPDSVAIMYGVKSLVDCTVKSLIKSELMEKLSANIK